MGYTGDYKVSISAATLSGDVLINNFNLHVTESGSVFIYLIGGVCISIVAFAIAVYLICRRCNRNKEARKNEEAYEQFNNSAAAHA
jgi:hypothetical protein